MSPKALLSRLPVDPYIVAIVGMVCLASGLPANGSGAIVARYATNAAIALLFFLHGARLSPRAALAGASHWRHTSWCLPRRSFCFRRWALARRRCSRGC
jgi:solute carrier family 10 (sodium/bile acid cotransporter), member 7